MELEELKNNSFHNLLYVNVLIREVKNVFFVIGCGFAVFAGVMLMNFITVSISYRKREIGILRAVGARGKDVFKIFFYEYSCKCSF